MVRMASRLTFGNTMADWQERIDVARLREARAERARQVMRKHGIPALLVSRADNNRYLTGLRGPEFAPQLWYILFFAEHDPVVCYHAGWINQMQDQAPWIDHWKHARCWLGGAGGPTSMAEEVKLFASGIVAELKERGLAGERLAMTGLDGVSRESLVKVG